MGTSDNTHVSNLKCRHYLMYFFCVSLFLLPHKLSSLSFSCLGHDRLRPNEMNFCSKPRTTCCTPRRNRFETVRQNIFIFLRGRSFSIFKLECCSLILNLWMPQNEKKKKKRSKKLQHSCFIAREELKQELSSYIGRFGLFWRFWDKRLVPEELPLRYPVGFFGTFSLSWEPSYPASYHGHIPGFSLVVFFNCRNSELLLCQCQGHWRMLSGVAMLHILDFNCLCEWVCEREFEVIWDG